MSSSDLKPMREIWTAAGLPAKPRGRDSLPNLLRQQRASPDLFLGAFAGGKMLGAAIASDDGRKGWINRLAVHPDFQRKGVGGALVRECEAALRKRGRRLFAVLIEDYNDVSREFFEHTGFRLEKEIRYYTKRELNSF